MNNMILETKCLQDGLWIGLVQGDRCLCSVGSEVFLVGVDDYRDLPGCTYLSERVVIAAFKQYAIEAQKQKEEEKRLKSLAHRYEFRDGNIVPYGEPF